MVLDKKNAELLTKEKVFFVLVFLFILLNYGLQVIQVATIPFGELLMISGFVVFYNRMRLLSGFSFTPEFFVFLIFWIIGVTHLLFDVPEYGFWALRDSSHLLESFAIFLGFCLPFGLFTWFSRNRVLFGWAVFVYSLTFIVRDELVNILPVMTTSAGAETTIFSYVSTASLLMVVAFVSLINYENGKNYKGVFIFGIVLAYAVVVFQSRTTYVQFFLLTAYVAFRQKGVFVNLFGALFVALIGVSVISLFDIQSFGRLGVKFDLNAMFNHILAMTGAPSEGFDDAAAGVGHRMDWWENIWNVATENFSVMYMGQGYGLPLIDFMLDGDVVVREPHNSYISVFGRLGLVGLFSILVVHVALYFRAGLVANWLNKINSLRGEVSPAFDSIFMFLICVTAFSLAEDGMEKPFFAIPFYLFFGIIFRLSKSINKVA